VTGEPAPIPSPPTPASASAGDRSGGGSPFADARRILVVDLGFLGDTIHLIPALRELRRQHPRAALHVVTTPIGAEVLGLVPGIDRVWVHPLGKPSPPWWRHLGLIRDLRRQGFDLGLNFSGADRTLFVAAAAGVRHRITRAVRRYAFWQRWLAGRVIPAPSRALPVYEQRRQVLALAGYALAPARFDLGPPAPDAAWARDQIPAEAVHLSISASTPFKEWPVPAWGDLAKRLLAGGVPVLVATGSPNPRERARLADLARTVNDDRLRVIAEALPIARLTALVARCSLHVGTDSGVTHIAFALDRPTVSIFREYAGLDEWRPRGERHRSLTAPCGCVDRPRMKPECAAAGTALCLAGIGVQPVAEAVFALRLSESTRGR
jgi:heptosyltransferase-1